ncbi:MAG TPA: PAS domain-containing sensor histidine kinase, partial [Maribacter sp.]|nr:PAS domain-containing sensor histidine kinase [Maribacter sp.]
MDSKEVVLLKKALERQKKARQQAERILEEKSNELYEVASHLRESNAK